MFLRGNFRFFPAATTELVLRVVAPAPCTYAYSCLDVGRPQTTASASVEALRLIRREAGSNGFHRRDYEAMNFLHPPRFVSIRMSSEPVASYEAHVRK